MENLNETREDLIDTIISMLPVHTPNYKLFSENKYERLLLEVFDELHTNKQILEIKNFPVKSTKEYLISIRCILNNKRIKIPARTSKCIHVDCIEAKILFLYILSFGRCPLCTENITVGVDSIYVDQFLKFVFNQYESTVFLFDYFILNKDNLKWRPYDPKQIEQESKYLYYNDEIMNFNIDEHLKEIEDINSYIGNEENPISIKLLTDKYRRLFLVDLK
jgi:hypothetical protein